jgi:para-nitrobenzyl esterase
MVYRLGYLGFFAQAAIDAEGHLNGRYFVALQYDLAENPILSAAEYSTAVRALWGPTLNSSVLALYPFAGYHSGGEALGASGTNGFFSCPARNAAQSLSTFVPVYAYEFNDENAPLPQFALSGPLTFPLGAYHTAELPYFFAFPTVSLSPAQQQLSDTMVAHRTQFAKTGDPNSPGAPVWSPYSATADPFQSLLPPTPDSRVELQRCPPVLQLLEQLLRRRPLRRWSDEGGRTP